MGQRQAFGAIEGQRETDSVLLMISQLNTLPGRKSVLFMSPGMPTTGDTDMFKMIVDKANKSNVTVYAVDVNGLAAELEHAGGQRRGNLRGGFERLSIRNRHRRRDAGEDAAKRLHWKRGSNVRYPSQYARILRRNRRLPDR